MTPRGIADLLEETGALSGLAEADRELVAGCGRIRAFSAGELLFREGEPADAFYVIRHGRLALRTHVQGRGDVTVETLGPGEIAGWSWLVSPYVWHFDGRVLEDGSAVEFDGACLRDKLEADPRLGYDLMRRFAAMILDRLQQTRVQMLDVYGEHDG